MKTKLLVLGRIVLARRHTSSAVCVLGVAVFGAMLYGPALLTSAAIAGEVADAADSSRRVAQQTDRLLTVELIAEHQVATRTNDETYLRRVFFDLIGQPPTPDDVLAFVLDQDPDKRTKIVDTLLADEEFGRNWGRYWRDVIFYRRSEDRSVLAIRTAETYLSEQLNANAGWDDVATEMITALGDVRDNGATALIMAQGGKPEETVAEISRIFLGIQIQCAQCHDHPTDRWTREQFHQLAAFFPRVAVRQTRDGDRRSFVVNATDRQFRLRRTNNNNRTQGTLEHYMPNLENPTERGELMEPVLFVNGKSLDRGTPDADRRDTLADWITDKDSPWFAKAYVNRIWSELVGEGFYEPVDDLGPDRDCQAPKTLDHLAAAFAENNYDTKWLFRTITATEAYQRASRSRRNPEQTAFLANCAQRLRGDQLYDALTSALDLPQISGQAGPYGQQRGPRGQFSQAFGFDPSDRRDEVAGTIPQALALMNAPLIASGISSRRDAGLGRLLREHQENRPLVDELYLRTLARRPTDREVKICLAYVAEVGNRNEAFEDVLWSLVNSTEFLYRK